MLSIGKLAAGQARYYLDQAEARVDVVGSVGNGIEDYYGGGGEARGTWIGAAVRALGLGGEVDGEALRRVLDGRDPWSCEALRDPRSRARVAGFDLTFSAPKSVSVVFGVADLDVRTAVRRGHDRAVAEALDYLERSAAAVRRGRGGAMVHETGGLVAAAFRHRTSRMGDPQLHTHFLVANLGRGPDGRWSALDARRIYAHARVASFVYQAVLRGELTRELGVAWTPVRDGIAEVDGVPAEVMRTFSRRRAQIEASLAERGVDGARAAEAAALATRRRKGPSLEADALAANWRERAARVGFGRGDVERLLGRAVTRGLDPLLLAELNRELAGRRGLTRQRSSFGRRDVLLELCQRLPGGTTVTARKLEQAADAFLASSRVVPLIDPRGLDDDAFRRRDGQRMPSSSEERRYSTPELLAVEQRLVDRVRRSRRPAPTAGGTVEAAIAARPSLSAEQQAMVRHLCERGDAVAVIAGRAGTGKTFALGAAREAWEAAGYPVRGAAVALRAARELQDRAGIESTTVASLVAGKELPHQVVLVIDEASMVGTRQLAALVERVLSLRGKVVLVGDHRQLPELDAGGVFRGLVHRGLAVELRENRRQVEPWERDALDQLRDGAAEAAIAAYASRDRIVAGADVRQRLVEDWRAAGDPDRAVMIARRRVDVADLNARARFLLREAGELRGNELTLPGGRFAVGDRVVVKRNAPQLGVSNGDRGHVTDVERDRLEIDCGARRATLDRAFLLEPTAHGDPSLVHGYAITGHVAQGLTTDRAYVLVDEGASREWLYVAMSRGREGNCLYIADDDLGREEFAPIEVHSPDALQRLARALNRIEAEPMAIDVAEEARRARRLDLQRRTAERQMRRARDDGLGIDR